MSLTEFKTMVTGHLGWNRSTQTEFSSWAANLNLAMAFANMHKEVSYISIIDSKNVGDHLSIFYTQNLHNLLETGPHPAGEYLVHGIISGDYLCSLSYKTLHDNEIRFSQMPYAMIDFPSYKPLTEEFIRRCRTVSGQYGERFWLPVALAILAQFKAQRQDPSQEDLQREIELVEKVLGSVQFEGIWWKDENIMRDVVANYHTNVEVKIFIQYLRHFARHLRKKHETENERRAQAALLERERKAAEAERAQKAKVAYIKARLERQLEIDMHRGGREANFGLNEDVIIKIMQNGEYDVLERFNRGDANLTEVSWAIARATNWRNPDEDTPMGGV